MIKINDKFIKNYNTISIEEKNKLDSIENIIEKKEKFLDWLDIETTISEHELDSIKKIAFNIKKDCDIFLVVGIGGSFLGTKALYESLKPYFKNEKIEIIFLGYNLDDEYLNEVIDHIKGKNVYVNFISKSGNTLETNYAYDRIIDYLKKNDSNYKNKIIITTGITGRFRNIVNDEGFISLNVPDNIGGRFSCLSVVGLFPLLIAGIDIDKLIDGASSVRNCFDVAGMVALIRYHLEQSGKKVEAVTIYNEKLYSFSLWYQQLFCETQGKNGKGIFSFPNVNTTNLHSIGQYFQEGTKQVFETVIKIESDKSLNGRIIEPIAQAHFEGDTPSLIISIEKIDEYNLGQLIYFLELVSTIGAYLLDVNPFDQPGVEKYKEYVNSIV